MFASICLANLDRLVYFLGATIKTKVYVKQYLTIIILFSCFQMLSYFMEVLVKADKRPRLSIIGVSVSACTNIILDYVFVIKLNYGVKGAAFATILAQMTSFTLFLVHFLKGKSILKFAKIKLEWLDFKRTIFNGFSDFILEISVGVTTYIFNIIILNVIGDLGIISYTIITYINMLVLNTMLAVSQGVQPIVSFNYGKKNKKIILGYFKLSLLTITFFSIITYFVCNFYSLFICKIFINIEKTNLLNYAKSAIKIYSLMYIVVGFNIIFCGLCTAVEKPKYALIISLGRGFIVINIVLLAMTKLYGNFGIWIASFISEMICFIISVVIFTKINKNLNFL